MPIYDYNTETVNEQLTPPQLRQPNFLAWLKVLTTPIQWLRDWFFDVYIGATTYPPYNALAAYNRGDRVFFYDNKGLYERTVTGSASGFDGPPSDLGRWFKLQDNFIGVDERVKYNAQIIVFEYALNTFFFTGAIPYKIYIQNNAANYTTFVMGNAGPYSSNMANTAQWTTANMGNAPTFTPVTANFTIFVPNSVLSTLGLTAQDQENAIREFADKYKLAGTTYLVTGY